MSETGGLAPTPDVQAEIRAFRQHKRRYRVRLMLLGVVVVTVSALVAWLGLRLSILAFSKETQRDSYWRQTFILLGFAVNGRNQLIELRDSKSLSNFRSTADWAVLEYATFFGWGSYFVSSVVGLTLMLSSKESTLLFVTEIAFFLAGATYALVGAVVSRHSLESM